MFRAAVVLAACLSAAPADPPAGADAAASKAGLQKVADLAGDWKGAGKARTAGRDAVWTEALAVNWRFAAGGPSLHLAVTGGKFLAGGELRYDPAKKVYRLTLTDAQKKQSSYDGTLVKDKLVMTATDKATGDVTRLTLFTLAEGARLVMRAEVQAKGRGPFSERFAVAATKAGAAFAGGAKKPECLITGGLGTIAVTHAGETFYVCCSGCRDEFNGDPAKHVAALRGKK